MGQSNCSTPGIAGVPKTTKNVFLWSSYHHQLFFIRRRLYHSCFRGTSDSFTWAPIGPEMYCSNSQVQKLQSRCYQSFPITTTGERGFKDSRDSLHWWEWGSNPSLDSLSTSSLIYLKFQSYYTRNKHPQSGGFFWYMRCKDMMGCGSGYRQSNHMKQISSVIWRLCTFLPLNSQRSVHQTRLKSNINNLLSAATSPSAKNQPSASIKKLQSCGWEWLTISMRSEPWPSVIQEFVRKPSIPICFFLFPLQQSLTSLTILITLGEIVELIPLLLISYWFQFQSHQISCCVKLGDKHSRL